MAQGSNGTGTRRWALFGVVVTLAIAAVTSGAIEAEIVLRILLVLFGVAIVWWAGELLGLRLRWPFYRKPSASRLTPPKDEPTGPTESWKALNKEREARYAKNRGLFLVHTWQPSSKPGQVADVRIWLHQHGPGPLEQGTVDAVEYTFGPKFEEHSKVRRTPADGFLVEESMWGPMLCLAKVYFADGSPPLILDRYINFAEDATTRLSDEERRRRLKMLLVRRAQEGDALGDQPAEKRLAWSNSVYDLLHDAFGSERFGLPGVWGGGRTLTQLYTLRRLISQLEEYDLRPEFDPRDWE